MRLGGEVSALTYCGVIVATAVTTRLISRVKNTRNLILSSLHYLFFLPSLVYISAQKVPLIYYVIFISMVLLIHGFSRIPMPSIPSANIEKKSLLLFLALLLVIAVALQLSASGFQNFNLNPERVYEFREKDALTANGLIGYLYSNVTNAIVPLAIGLSLHFRSWALGLVILSLVIMLYGSAYHKSIVFLAALPLIYYLLLKKYDVSKVAAILPVSVVGIALAEMCYSNLIVNLDQPGILTSYLVRRPLFVPPMVDFGSFEVFSVTQKYFWSESRISMNLLVSPHGMPAPQYLGVALFNDPSMSANPGLVGSGYANAGGAGVVIYSAVFGLIISLLNQLGRRVSHELVFVASLPALWVILTSTDLVTALLSHGLLALVVMLLLLPLKPEFKNPQ